MEKTLGEILVEKQVLSPTQLDVALRKQKEQKGKYLGQILIELGYVRQEKLNKFLDTFNKRKRIGEILLDLKVINQEQLETALQEQSRFLKKGIRKPLGLLILEMGFTGHDNYLRALSRHFNMAVVSLENFLPTQALQRILGEKYTTRNKIVVLENTPSRIKLALAEPTHFLLEEIQKALPTDTIVEFYLADPLELENCFRKRFDPFSLTRYS